MNFSDKLSRSIAQRNSLLFVSLDPNPELMPDRYANSLDGLRNWMQDVIAATADLVCAYKPTIGFYEAIGAGGLELLEQTLSLIPPEIPIILDAKHSDLNTSTLLARTVFEKWKIDAITISAYAGQDLAAPFLLYPGKAVFVTCKTANASAIAIQQDSNLYLQIIEEVCNWGTPEQVGLEVGLTTPEIIAKVRSIAPERLILARSIWANPDRLRDILAAGLNNNGEGLLIPVPQDWLAIDRLNEQVRSLNQTINSVRETVRKSGSSCDLWLSNLPDSAENRQQNLIVQLFDIGCILFGEFVQASGATFPYYIDLRKIISNPQIFHQILTAYAEILQNLQFDRIAGIPYGSLPTATGLALRLNRPMIFPRKEVKAHGTRRVIEGNFVPGETVVVVDDILISGNSAIEGAEKIESVGLNVEDIVVFLDHEQGVKDRLKASGYRAHSVLTLSEISNTLYRVGRISEEQYRSIAQSNHES